MKLKDLGLTKQDIKDKVSKYMIDTYERFDFLAETAEGMYMYDENGTPYLDFYAGIAVNNAGSRNPKVVAAVKDQVDDIMHTFNYPYTIPQALLAEKVCTTIGMDKIFYQNSGTEANEAMIKMARKYGVDNETSEVAYTDNQWSEYLNLCKEYRQDKSAPTMKELQNEEIVSKDGYAKSGFIMFSDNYNEDDTMICCRLWKGKNKTGIVLDSSRLRGSIANVFENALNFIERNTKTGWVKTEKGGRDEIRSYPKEAVREALVNAIAHRDYSISGTQIDVDIYSDRIEIVSPGSWLLPKDYNAYPAGSIPSIRRNAIIAACLDVANLMERGGTGFQTMMESYKSSPDELQPVVSIYPGFLNLRLYDRLFRDEAIELDLENLTDAEKVMAILKMEGPKPIKELQMSLNYRSRSQFLNEVINPLMKSGEIYRDGKPKSPTALIKIKK